MASLSLRHIYKVYNNGCKAVSDFNLEIANNDFVVFVGPSGCGKSTTLRMIAGLEDISAGELYIDNVLVNNMEPKDRDISMVFQNYALYPHMTVYDNMAFGLKLRHVPQELIHKKVIEVAKALKIIDYLDKKPRAMSGGQRQRVALGRAILRSPKAFLLDEPLSNLDAKLRTEMRTEIAKLHKTIKTTFIYVTHDQVEAMTLGTKVVVMKSGFIQQVDTPQNLYNYPCNKFVAGFIGTPQMNFFQAKLKRIGEKVEIKLAACDAKFVVDANYLAGVRPYYLRAEEDVTIGLRCEHISLNPNIVSKAKHKIKVKISHFEDLGSETLVYCNLNLKEDTYSNSDSQIIIKLYKKDYSLKSGDVVEAAFDLSMAHYFDKDTEESIKPRIPKDNVFDCSIKSNVISFLSQKIKLPNAIKVEDINNVELFVPTDAIDFKGKYECKVIEIKKIDGKQIISLKLDNRIFYAVSDINVKVGAKVKVGFDITRISVMKRDITIIPSLPTFNNFVGTVMNIANEKKASHNLLKYYDGVNKNNILNLEHEKQLELAKLGMSNVVLKDLKKAYKDNLKKEKEALSERIGLNTLGKDRIKEEKKLYKKRLYEAKEKYFTNRVNYRKEIVKIVITEDSRKKAKLIEEDYNDRINQLNNLYKDKIELYEKGFEASRPYCEKCIKDDLAVYKKDISILDNNHKKTISSLNNQLDRIVDRKDPNRKVINDKIDKENLEYKKQKELIVSKSKTFFINIFGSCLKLDPMITRKIVQALGVSIFNVQYRYAIGLDSIKVVNGSNVNGPILKLKVDKFLDYGKEKFIVGVINDTKAYVKVNKIYKKGDSVKVTFDLSNLSIFENKLDIRLY